ncbi:MAG: Magnesium and cobalt efflux protein CorC [Ignavibacteriae bacterium]|nr:MAG: Magnesium and cobalt efflux protein CorC [Ignavibacteriota bacterium]
MDASILTYFITFTFLLFLSAFFSGSEIAFFSLKDNYLNIIANKYKLTHKIISYLLKNPSKLLVTILICNTIVNVSIAIVAVFITIDIIQFTSANEILSVFIEIILVTVILLLFGEISPKILARKYPLQFSQYAAFPIFLLYVIFLPISKLFEFITSSVNFIFKDTNKNKIPQTELKYIIDLIDSKSDIDLHTKYFLKRINEFANLIAKDIQTPRVKLNAIEINSSLSILHSLFKKTKSLYIPVYEKNMDNIVGVISLKRYLNTYIKVKKDASTLLEELLEKPLYIPETKKVQDVLSEMKKSSVPVAVVIDEHGGVSGMLTEEDILKIFL